jgi:hypothetical protein
VPAPARRDFAKLRRAGRPRVPESGQVSVECGQTLAGRSRMWRIGGPCATKVRSNRRRLDTQRLCADFPPRSASSLCLCCSSPGAHRATTSPTTWGATLRPKTRALSGLMTRQLTHRPIRTWRRPTRAPRTPPRRTRAPRTPPRRTPPRATPPRPLTQRRSPTPPPPTRVRPKEARWMRRPLLLL